MKDEIEFVRCVDEFTRECYENSKAHGFWDGVANDNEPTKIALMHSELSELLEAFRKGDPPCEKPIDIVGLTEDKHTIWTRRITSREEEVADLFIRLLDYCGRYGIPLATVVLAKHNYNKSRSFRHGGKKV